MNCSNSCLVNAAAGGTNNGCCGGTSSARNTESFQQTVLSALGAIQTTNDQILLTMQEILRYNKKIAIEKLIAPEHLPCFPLKTYEDFLNFEQLAKDDPTVNQYMVSFKSTNFMLD